MCLQRAELGLGEAGVLGECVSTGTAGVRPYRHLKSQHDTQRRTLEWNGSGGKLEQVTQGERIRNSRGWRSKYLLEFLCLSLCLSVSMSCLYVSIYVCDRMCRFLNVGPWMCVCCSSCIASVSLITLSSASSQPKNKTDGN